MHKHTTVHVYQIPNFKLRCETYIVMNGINFIKILARQCFQNRDNPVSELSRVDGSNYSFCTIQAVLDTVVMFTLCLSIHKDYRAC